MSAIAATFIGLVNTNKLKHELSFFCRTIVFDLAFSKHYSSTQGKPAKPIRLMVPLLILKQLRNLSDESMVEQWSESMYYQYFSGAQTFTPKRPCVAKALVEFRKRIGPGGVELILKESIRVNGKDGDEDPPSGDTTVHCKVRIVSYLNPNIVNVYLIFLPAVYHELELANEMTKAIVILCGDGPSRAPHLFSSA